MSKLHEFVVETECALRHIFFHSPRLPGRSDSSKWTWREPSSQPPFVIASSHHEQMNEHVRLFRPYGKNVLLLRQDSILLSDVVGVSAFVNALSNSVIENASASSPQSPLFTHDGVQSAVVAVPFRFISVSHAPLRPRSRSESRLRQKEGEVHVCRGLYAYLERRT